MTKPADLIAYLFEGLLDQREDAPRLSGELLRWMDSSTRYTNFVETYRDKIRKKIRVTRDAESALDVRSELEVAYSLLNDRRLAVTYEPYASAKRRGADFSVTYRVNLVFNIEVARLRVEADGAALPQDVAERLAQSKEERLLRILMDKLGQMQPGMPNLLAIHTRADLVRSIDLDRLMQVVKTRVEGKDPAFFAGSRYSGSTAFYKDFLHLSGILVWASAPDGAARLWINKQARPGLDEKVIRLVATALESRGRAQASGASAA